MIRGRSIDDSDIRKFFKEVHTWSKLDDDHILPLRGITLELGGTLSIISPWMANGSAKGYIHDGSKDPAPLLRDVAAGLHYLHTREEQVFHGDLKADNIMVTEDGRGLLADFGFSVLVSNSFSLAITHPTGGTRLWMAPEKLAGEGDSAAADIYSFAMLTVELFTRKDPFHGETPRVTLEAVQDRRRPQKPSPVVTLDRLRDNWWNICQACWAHDPSERWTAKRILESLTQTTIQTMDSIDAPLETRNENAKTLTFVLREQARHNLKSQASRLIFFLS
ncbi:kinase-like domain-containing protein [Mycena metata]|uniref:Kinase-like domain-containing protein n=1 Tax=Mycena metata TaxID=1033252 RepID=A0AAD7IY54_9AGAR|nr:kinase-like domain-containing protein [Mycena metata]